MTEADERHERAVERTRRDLERLERRPARDDLWRAMRVLGSVGWPIALFAVGGAVLGRTVAGPPWLGAAAIAGGAALGGLVALTGLWRRT